MTEPVKPDYPPAASPVPPTLDDTAGFHTGPTGAPGADVEAIAPVESQPALIATGKIPATRPTSTEDIPGPNDWDPVTFELDSSGTPGKVAQIAAREPLRRRLTITNQNAVGGSAMVIAKSIAELEGNGGRVALIQPQDFRRFIHTGPVYAQAQTAIVICDVISEKWTQ